MQIAVSEEFHWLQKYKTIWNNNLNMFPSWETLYQLIKKKALKNRAPLIPYYYFFFNKNFQGRNRFDSAYGIPSWSKVGHYWRWRDVISGMWCPKHEKLSGYDTWLSFSDSWSRIHYDALIIELIAYDWRNTAVWVIWNNSVSI